MNEQEKLYTPAFVTGFIYNFVISLNFTNNALYPLFIRDLGGGPVMIGLFMSLYAIVAVILRPFIGRLIDRRGPVFVLMLGAFFMSIPVLGFIPFIHGSMNPLIWALRLLQGFGFGAHFSATFTYAVLIAPARRRNEAVAMYGVSGLAGNLFGPSLGEYLIATHGFAAFFMFIAGVGVVGMAFVTRMRAPHVHVEQDGINPMRTVAKAPGMMFVLVLAGFLALAYSTPSTFLAASATDRGITGFGLYFTGYGLAGMCIRFIGSTWGDRFGALRVLAPAFFFYGVGLLLVAVSASTIALFCAGLVTGFSHGIAFPAVTTLGYERAPRQYAGTAMALITGMMDAGLAFTAFSAAPIAQYFGYDVVFPIAGAACFIPVTLIVRKRILDAREVEAAS